MDARNAFNEMDRSLMLWTIRHEWPQGARFTFNCYRHWAILFVRGQDGHGIFVHSKIGVTQGDPLSMVAYGVGLLPLIKHLIAKFPDLFQPWYADDAAAVQALETLDAFFCELLAE